jgi:hypothetical protein
MPELTEEQHKGEFLVTEANGSLSRESATVLSGQNLKPGHVLGKVAVGTATGAAVSGNTGNGAISAVSAGATAKPGVYTANCIEPATNGGTFSVEDPDGVNVGTAAVGTPFAGPVNFTIADGATDFVAGDRFTITVAAGSGKYKEYNPRQHGWFANRRGDLARCCGCHKLRQGRRDCCPPCRSQCRRAGLVLRR